MSGKFFLRIDCNVRLMDSRWIYIDSLKYYVNNKNRVNDVETAVTSALNEEEENGRDCGCYHIPAAKLCLLLARMAAVLTPTPGFPPQHPRTSHLLPTAPRARIRPIHYA